MEQIFISVQRSRRTIIVLSKSFLESRWSLTEFRIAHIKASTTENVWVIVILYNITIEEVIKNVDQELRAYLINNTYVKWDDPYFWTKLKRALGKKRSNLHKENDIQNNSDLS